MLMLTAPFSTINFIDLMLLRIREFGDATQACLKVAHAAKQILLYSRCREMR